MAERQSVGLGRGDRPPDLPFKSRYHERWNVLLTSHTFHARSRKPISPNTSATYRLGTYTLPSLLDSAAIFDFQLSPPSDPQNRVQPHDRRDSSIHRTLHDPRNWSIQIDLHAPEADFASESCRLDLPIWTSAN